MSTGPTVIIIINNSSNPHHAPPVHHLLTAPHLAINKGVPFALPSAVLTIYIHSASRVAKSPIINATAAMRGGRRDQHGCGWRLELPAERQQGRVTCAANNCVRHLVGGLVVEASCSVQTTLRGTPSIHRAATRALLVQLDGPQQLLWGMSVRSPVPGK